MNTPTRLLSIAGSLLAAALIAGTALADEIPAGWTARNMNAVGYTALGDHPGAFKLAIKKVNERWYLYTAHSGAIGLSIVDVTDAANPKFVKFIPGPAGTAGPQVTLHDNLLVWGLSKPFTLEMTSGQTGPRQRVIEPASPKDKPYEEGAKLYDISDPVNPKLLSHWEGGATGTHRNGYPGGRYAYMTSTAPGFSGNILIIVDVSDPAKPKEAGRWWYPGQKDGETATGPFASFHGPVNVSPDGKTATIGYTPSVLNLDISDVAHPKMIGEVQMSPPFAEVGTQSVHSVLPLWDRKLIFANSESMKVECKEGLQWGGLFDNQNPAKPVLISMLPIPVPTADAPFKDFCTKGGRFGPHNTNQEIHLPDVEKPGNLIYLTYFNAGLRVFDIENPRLPTETGWFVPPNPAKPMRAQGGFLTVNQTQDVLVDTRGNIYITDSAWGIWVARYSGPNQPAPTAK